MNPAAAPRVPDVHPAEPLASWYMPGLIDGFGDRLLMIDNAASDALELLRFRAALRDTPGFEEALQEGVRQLRGLMHAAFPAVRGVERLDRDGSLVLVSTSTPGLRLSQFLDERQSGKGLYPAFVVSIVNQALEAISALHAAGEAVAHTALTADRIILAPDGRVRVVEHVLGCAVRHLDRSSAQLWQEFGILALSDDSGRPRLDRPGDVFQLGVLALSMLLARRITRDDVDGQLPSLLDQWSESARSTFNEPLRHWLEQALQIVDSPYGSATEAQGGLPELPLLSASKAFAFLQAGSADAEATQNLILQSTAPIRRQEEEIAHDSAMAAVEVSQWSLPAATPPADTPITGSIEVSTRASVKPSEPSKSRALRFAIGLVVVAGLVAQGAVIAMLLLRQTPAPAASPAAAPPPPAVISAAPPAPAGVEPGAITPADAAAVLARQNLEAMNANIAEAARNQRSGGVRLSAPIELTVVRGDRVLGSSADGPIVTTAGTHDVELINTALGFRARRSLTFRAGEITTLTVSIPSGRINLNATPWAEVSIDGRQIGETPLANVEIPLGEHEVVFRHPEFGERRQRVVVRADAVARASTTFDR